MGVAASEGAWVSFEEKDVVDQSISNGCIAVAAVQGLFHQTLIEPTKDQRTKAFATRHLPLLVGNYFYW